MSLHANPRLLTFITTLMPCSFKIRGANSEWRDASRLYLVIVSSDTQAYNLQFYLANAANIAIAGGCSITDDEFVIHNAKTSLTVGSLEDGRNKVSLVSMMERSDRELELVRQLRRKSPPITGQAPSNARTLTKASRSTAS